MKRWMDGDRIKVAAQLYFRGFRAETQVNFNIWSQREDSEHLCTDPSVMWAHSTSPVDGGGVETVSTQMEYEY